MSAFPHTYKRLFCYPFAFALGAITVLAYAPFNFFPLAVATLAALFALVLREASAVRASCLSYCFGLGLFSFGISWIYISLHEFGDMHAALAAITTVVFCSFLALFPALFGVVASLVHSRASSSIAFSLPAIWVAIEWLRGSLFTGFPWLTFGYSQIPASPLSGYAPVLGAYGVSLTVALSASLLLCLCWSSHGRRAIHVGVLLGIWGGGWIGQQIAWTSPVGTQISVSLLQGNVPQDQKWRPDKVASTQETYLSLVRKSQGKLIVLPETAIPQFADELGTYIEAIRAAAVNSDIILGVPERVLESGTAYYYNSAISVGVLERQTYRKHHLVPFGEFFPASSWLNWVPNVLDIPLSNLSSGAQFQNPLQVAGEKVAVNICFEDVFGEEIIRALPAATLLVNLSNIAWFGDSLAIPQHLQISQMRAMETGRYMLRATNTGATAIIDERGRVVRSAAPLEVSVLTGLAQGFTGATPYVLFGNVPVLILCLGGIGIAFWIGRTSPTKPLRT